MDLITSLFPETIGSCFDVQHGPREAPYLNLTGGDVYNWASLEANLSMAYKQGTIGSSETLPNGKNMILDVLDQMDVTFRTKYSDVMGTYEERFRPMLAERLRDPGMLHNAIYFHVATDPDMIGFYWHTWFGDMAKSMDFLHDYAWDPLGRGHPVDPNGAWYHMSRLEGMNNSERIKAKDFVKQIRWTFNKLYDRPRITFFGGGNIPERHYDLPPSIITVFDPNTITPVEKLFDIHDKRWEVNYFRESLFDALKHEDLFETQSAVEMYGTALYLGEMMTKKAILVGEKLLHEHGRFAFDYLVLNESMRRVFYTQFWHVERDKTDIFDSAGDAINRGIKTVRAVNNDLIASNKITRFVIEDIRTTTVGIWGATGVRFFLKKVYT
ncbi:hypothetical protein IKG20_02940 [Candidatus Saccharibacteria bacterium]|nr:hypothetical protein [Candidatus Saccharibacteria bacterium]